MDSDEPGERSAMASCDTPLTGDVLFRGGPRRRAAVVVAHPDDETLWVGGVILDRPDWDWTIVSVCRASDVDREPKFRQAVECYSAAGHIGDTDDSPRQLPLDPHILTKRIASLIPKRSYDVVFTHGPFGEYTRHRRHEEVSRAVCRLWRTGKLAADELWLFAYSDGDRAHLPEAEPDAHVHIHLTVSTWTHKQRILVGTYGLAQESFEVRTCPQTEAFWTFASPEDFTIWLSEIGGRP